MITQNFFYTLLSLVPATINIGIVIYVIFFLPRNRTTDIFTLFVIALTIWQTEDTLFRAVASERMAYIFDKMFCIGWMSAGPLAFHFACRFASLKIIHKRPFLVAVYLPFIVIYLFYVSATKMNFVHDQHWGWITTSANGIIDGIGRSCAAIAMLATVFVIVQYAFRMRKNKLKKLQAGLMAFGILVPTVGGIITQVAFPLLFSMNELPITSSLMTFISMASIISLSKYRLFTLSDSVAIESILSSLTNMVLVVSPERKVLYMNPYTKKMFRGDLHECPDFPNENNFSSSQLSADFDREVLAVALAGRPVKNYATRLRLPGDTMIDVLISAQPVINNGVTQGVLLVGNDMTEHLKLLEELKVSDERYNLVSRATNDMVWDWNLQTGEMYRNREGLKKIFDEVQVREIGESFDWTSMLHPDDREKIVQLKTQILNGWIDDSFDIECRVMKSDGSISYVRDRGYVVKDVNGKPVRAIGAAQDITQRKLAEQMFKEAQLRKHKEITDAVIVAQENERRIIGTELHDNINQILTSATLYLNLARTEADVRNQYFEQTQRIIANAMQEVRKLSHTLIPPSLSGETLVEALGHLIETTEKTGLFVVHREFKDFKEEELSQKLKLIIYRIVQEQLKNIIEHAEAKTVVIKLGQRHDQVNLFIHDDGVGFDMSKKWKGIGLKNIETRAFLHNGKVEIASSPNNGCTLQLVFPN